MPQQPPGPAAAPVPSAARRILVVDDNEDAVMSLGVLLRMSGNEVETAKDGVEAVERAAAFQPDVILLDIGLPRMNGYDACRAIRQQPQGGDILIVALTGWGQDEDRHKSGEAGFNNHLVKPVDLAALMALLAPKAGSASQIDQDVL
jgi:CheY-like chemotaxis protein